MATKDDRLEATPSHLGQTRLKNEGLGAARIEASMSADGYDDAPHRKGKKGKKKEKDGAAGTKRGIETLFQTAYQTHIGLSALADTKANIMISINGIIISIIMATVASSVAGNPWLLLPAAALLLTCATALVFSVLAAMPRVRASAAEGALKREHKMKNLLFFGTFTAIPEAEFVEGIKDLMRRRGELYSAMAGDLYSLGGVLSRKYRLIRIAYGVFMVGLVLAVVLLVAVLGVSATASPPPPSF
jgi:hypothetical protein